MLAKKSLALLVGAILISPTVFSKTYDLGPVSNAMPLSVVKNVTFSQTSGQAFVDHYTFEVVGEPVNIGLSAWSGSGFKNGMLQEIQINSAALYSSDSFFDDRPDGGMHFLGGTPIRWMEEDTYGFGVRALQAGTYVIRIAGDVSAAESVSFRPGMSPLANYSLGFTMSPVPEVGNVAMAMIGLAGVAFMLRRQQQRR